MKTNAFSGERGFSIDSDFAGLLDALTVLIIFPGDSLFVGRWMVIDKIGTIIKDSHIFKLITVRYCFGNLNQEFISAMILFHLLAHL